MRSTVHKQNSLITRCCLAAVVLLALLGPLVGESRGDFSLYGDDYLTVNTFHLFGELHDQSEADIVFPGEVLGLRAYDTSTVNANSG